MIGMWILNFLFGTDDNNGRCTACDGTGRTDNTVKGGNCYYCGGSGRFSDQSSDDSEPCSTSCHSGTRTYWKECDEEYASHWDC